MGWNLSTIIINNVHQFDEKKVHKILGAVKSNQIEDEVFDAVMCPEELNEIYLCHHNNLLIITNVFMPFQFYTTNLSRLEKKLIKAFPTSEIGTFSLFSSINYFGFAIIQNKKKIRVKTGDAESDGHLDFGQPLEEEKYFFKNSILNNGTKMYYLDEDPTELFTEDQIGDELVFKIIQRFLPNGIDDDAFGETLCHGYKKRLWWWYPATDWLKSKLPFSS